MSYINREEAIRQIEEVQSLYTGQLFDLIGRTLDIVKNMPDEPVEEIRLANSIKTNGKKIEGKYIDLYCK